MPRGSPLELSAAEQRTEDPLRDHGRTASLRERAVMLVAMLVAIAAGATIRQAAVHAGRKPHDADTVCIRSVPGWPAIRREDWSASGSASGRGASLRPRCSALLAYSVRTQW